MSKSYIGYGTLEEWARCIDKARPVYASSITSPGQNGKHGIRIDTAEIVCAQPDARGDVHYCRMTLGQWQEMAGVPDFGKRRRDEVLERQKGAWALVKAWLAEQGLDARDALVAFPKSLRYLDGWAGFLRWDKEAEQFARVDVIDPALLELEETGEVRP